MSVAVVAGASGELGSAIAVHLARHDRPVLAVARRLEPLEALAAHQPWITPCPADLRDSASLDALRPALAGRSVALLVNCAGAPPGGGILSVDPAAILAAVDVKVNGLLRLVRALDANLSEGARIVALGGNLGYDPTPDAGTAGVAGAALANAVRQMARALGPRGITCHVVAPGPVDTPRFRALAASEASRRGVTIETIVAEAAAAAPLGRLITRDEVAWAVALLGDPSAAALTGGTLLVDGGRRSAIP